MVALIRVLSNKKKLPFYHMRQYSEYFHPEHILKDNSAIQCKQCGSCCHADMIAYVTGTDILRWEQEQRFDIISHISGNEIQWFGDILMTSTGIHIQSCSFLDWNGKVFFCDIYETRPHVCRDYIPGSSAICPLYPNH